MKLLRINSNKHYIFIPEFIWDGISNTLLRKHAVFVKHGVIHYIGPASDLNLTVPDIVETVVLPEMTLIPGLVDCHVHLAMNCSDLFEAISDWENSTEKVIFQAHAYAEDYLRNGIVAVRDGGDKTSIGLCLKNMVEKGTLPGPSITSTGQAIYKQGMYGSFLGPGVTTTTEARKQIRAFRDNGVDQIKIIVSGLVSFKNLGLVGKTQFNLKELSNIIHEAHSCGLKVMAHASSSEAVETAVLAGADSIEHGYFLQTRQLELMVKHGTSWIPTLAPLGNLVRNNHIPYSGAELSVINDSFELQLRKVQEAFQIGVIMGIGTDAGANHVLHGYSYHDELRYYSEAGLDTATILKMATSISAQIIGKGELLGTITKGKIPYWCCVPGNPTENLRILQKPECVIIPDQSSV